MLKRMIWISSAGLGVLLSSLVLSLQSQAGPNDPRYTADGELIFPENYREWVWLSSGLGMTYGPSAAGTAANPRFDNVFVAPEAYRFFLENGTWPDRTIFVLEVRASATEGSINKGGRFQKDIAGVEVEVKDQRRFAGGWAFFAFGNLSARKSSPQIATSASCYSCHAQNGAVDNTFVQFYPTLIEIAQKKGTFKGN